MNNWKCATKWQDSNLFALKTNCCPVEGCWDPSYVPLRYWSRRGDTVRCGYGDPQLPNSVSPNSSDPPFTLQHTRPGDLPALILVQKTLLPQATELAPGRMTHIHLRGHCSGMTRQYRKDLRSVFLAWIYGERLCHWWIKSFSLALLERTQKAVKTYEWSVKAVQFHLLSLVMAGSLCRSIAKEWSRGHQLQFRMENPWTFPLEPEVAHPVFADDLLRRRRWLSSNCHKGHILLCALLRTKSIPWESIAGGIWRSHPNPHLITPGHHVQYLHHRQRGVNGIHIYPVGDCLLSILISHQYWQIAGQFFGTANI